MKVLLALSTIPLLLSNVNAQGGFYRNTDVLELDSSNFHEVVLNTNQTSIVEFYAPWCGHCQNLKNQFIKVGQHLDDIANVAAVNCDLGKNKKLCSDYRIEGYPTLMAFRPPKYDLSKNNPVKYGHATENYAGARKTKPIVDFTIGRIKNYVKRLATLEKLDLWLTKYSERPKFVVFPRKDKLSPLLKSVAVEFLGDIDFAYLPVSSSEKLDDLAQSYEIDPNGTKAVVYFFKDGNNPETKQLYTGEFSKEGIANFIKDIEGLEDSAERVLNRLDVIKKVKKGEKLNKKAKKGNNKNSRANIRDEL